MLQRLQSLHLRAPLRNQLLSRYANYTQKPTPVNGSETNKETFRESRLFVSNLPQAVTWKELKDFFAPSGAKYISISEDPNTGQSRGCGVVQYDSVDEAKLAVKRMNGLYMRGSSLKVRFDRKTKPALKKIEPGQSVGSIKVKYTSNPTYNDSLRRLIREQGRSATALPAENNAELETPAVRENAVNVLTEGALVGMPLLSVDAIAELDRLLDNKPAPVVYYRDKADKTLLTKPMRMQIEELVRQRAEVREKGDFRQSDTLRALLRDSYGVDCHDIQRTWTVCPEKHATLQKAAMLREAQEQRSAREAEKAASKAVKTKKAGVRLFVSNIPLSSSWQDLKDHFEKVGPKFARVQTDSSGKSTGCGLVQFETMKEAARALKALDGSTMQGSVLNVRFDVLDEFGAAGGEKSDVSAVSGAVASSRSASTAVSAEKQEPAVAVPSYQRCVDDVLYVSKAHQQAIAQLVQKRAVALAQGRTDAAQEAEEELLYAYDVKCNDQDRTWAVVKAASAAVKKSTNAVSAPMEPSRPTDARDARTSSRERSAASSPVRAATPSRLFVSNIPYEATWEDVKAHFADTGCTFVKVHYDEEKGGSKGTAVVEYDSAESAERAIARMDRSELGGLTLNVRADLEVGKRPQREEREARGGKGSEAPVEKKTEEEGRLEKARAGVDHLLAMQRLQEVLAKEKQRRTSTAGPEPKVFTHAQELEKMLAARRQKASVVDTDARASPAPSQVTPVAEGFDSDDGDAAPVYKRAERDINYVPRADLAEIAQLVQQRAQWLREGQRAAADALRDELLRQYSVACDDREQTWEVVTVVSGQGKRGGGAKKPAQPIASAPPAPKPVRRSEVGADDFADTLPSNRTAREEPGSTGDVVNATYTRAERDINYLPKAELAKVTELVQQRAQLLSEGQRGAAEELGQELLSGHSVKCNDRDGTWEVVTVVSSRKRSGGR